MEVLRAATAEWRVVVTNNVRDYALLVEDFGLRGETQFGVLFTDDDTFPRSGQGVGLLIRSLAAFVAGNTWFRNHVSRCRWSAHALRRRRCSVRAAPGCPR